MALGHFLESNRGNVESAVRCSGMAAQVIEDSMEGYVTVVSDNTLPVEQIQLFWRRYFGLVQDAVLEEIADVEGPDDIQYLEE